MRGAGVRGLIGRTGARVGTPRLAAEGIRSSAFAVGGTQGERSVLYVDPSIKGIPEDTSFDTGFVGGNNNVDYWAGQTEGKEGSCVKLAGPADPCFIADQDYTAVILKSGDQNFRFDNVKANDRVCNPTCEPLANTIFCGGANAPNPTGLASDCEPHPMQLTFDVPVKVHTEAYAGCSKPFNPFPAL